MGPPLVACHVCWRGACCLHLGMYDVPMCDLHAVRTGSQEAFGGVFAALLSTAAVVSTGDSLSCAVRRVPNSLPCLHRSWSAVNNDKAVSGAVTLPFSTPLQLITMVQVFHRDILLDIVFLKNSDSLSSSQSLVLHRFRCLSSTTIAQRAPGCISPSCSC